MAYDLESPNDDGSCALHITNVECLERKSIFDTSKTYCQWVENSFTTQSGTVFDKSGCAYAEPSYGWEETAMVSILVAMIMALINVPLDYLFGVLYAPTADTLANLLQEGGTVVKTAVTNVVSRAKGSVGPASQLSAAGSGVSNLLMRGDSTRMIDRSTLRARGRCSTKIDNRRKEFQLRNMERQGVRRELAEEFRCDFDKVENKIISGSGGKDIEAATDKADIHDIVHDMVLQFCQLKKHRMVQPYARFVTEWRYKEVFGTENQSARSRSAPQAHIRMALQDVTELADGKIDRLMKMRANDAHVGVEIMNEFLLDIIGRNTPVAKIFEQKTESHFSTAEIQSDWVKFLAGCGIAIINLLCVLFAILKGSVRGLSWQQHYLSACILQVIVEICLFETEVIIPQLVFDRVNIAFDNVMNTLDAMHEDKVASILASKGSKLKARDAFVNVLNVPDYLFVSTRLAKVFHKQIESSVVSRYESIYPSNNLAVLLKTVNEDDLIRVQEQEEASWLQDNWLFKFLRLSMFGSVYFAMLIRVAVVPMHIQQFVISTLQPVIFAAILVIIYKCVYNPWYFAIVFVVLVLIVLVVKNYVGNLSDKQRKNAELHNKLLSLEEVEVEVEEEPAEELMIHTAAGGGDAEDSDASSSDASSSDSEDPLDLDISISYKEKEAEGSSASASVCASDRALRASHGDSAEAEVEETNYLALVLSSVVTSGDGDNGEGEDSSSSSSGFSETLEEFGRRLLLRQERYENGEVLTPAGSLGSFGSYDEDGKVMGSDPRPNPLDLEEYHTSDEDEDE